MVLKELFLNSFLPSEGAVLGCGGVVVLKELILNNSIFGGCDGLERTHFEQFLL